MRSVKFGRIATKLIANRTCLTDRYLLVIGEVTSLAHEVSDNTMER